MNIAGAIHQTIISQAELSISLSIAIIGGLLGQSTRCQAWRTEVGLQTVGFCVGHFGRIPRSVSRKTSGWTDGG